MMYRIAEQYGVDVAIRADLTNFSDGDSVPEWAVNEIAWAVSAGLINGTVSDGLLSLDTLRLASREQVAAIVRRFADMIESGDFPRVPETPAEPIEDTEKTEDTENVTEAVSELISDESTEETFEKSEM